MMYNGRVHLDYLIETSCIDFPLIVPFTRNFYTSQISVVPSFVSFKWTETGINRGISERCSVIGQLNCWSGLAIRRLLLAT